MAGSTLPMLFILDLWSIAGCPQCLLWIKCLRLAIANRAFSIRENTSSDLQRANYMQSFTSYSSSIHFGLQQTQSCNSILQAEFVNRTSNRATPWFRRSRKTFNIFGPHLVWKYLGRKYHWKSHGPCLCRSYMKMAISLKQSHLHSWEWKSKEGNPDMYYLSWWWSWLWWCWCRAGADATESR